MSAPPAPTGLGTPGEKPLEAPKEQPLDVSASVKELWEEAAKAFEGICGESLQKGEMKNFDDLQRKIESANNSKATFDEGKKDKQEKAKKLGLKLLKYLKVLVGVATDASSLIPIPDSAVKIVSNALCFVFDTPEAIKGYKDAIDEVFSEVSSALSQFQIYGSIEKLHNLEVPLINQIHLVMVSLVKVCAHVVKYRQGRRADRLLQQFKFVLRDDSGLAEEMANFKRALQHQRDIEGTLTLAVLVETRNDLVEKLVVISKTTEETYEGVRVIKDNLERIDALNMIRNTFSLSDKPSLNARTTPMCTEISDKCLDGTGTWIWTHSAYTAWTAPKDTQDPHVLFLTGPPSSGRSSATALITKRLENQHESRIYVAHYFFGASGKKSDGGNPVPLALKHLAFQIARVDDTVRAALTKACVAPSDSLRRLENLDMIWSALKISAGSSATYYLVFDGLENLAPDQTKMLISFVFGPKLTGESAGRVRVLASWTEERFNEFRNSNSIPSFLQIRMEEHNGQDMRLIIENALATRGLLQDAKPDSMQQRAREKILNELPRNVHGSYSLLQFGIDEVIHVLSMRSSSEALDRVLAQSTSSREAAIKTLQRSLTVDEINELNELLKWVMYSSRGMTLDELEAALFLSSGTESLVSLRYIIKNKYSAVLKVEDDDVSDQDGLKEYLEKEKGSSSQASHSRESATISMTITIKNVDQELCGNFLWDLAHKAIRDKFSFDFATASPNTLSIAVDEFEAHHTIVKRAFEYLGKNPEEQTGPIGLYLVNWLPYHLEQLRELEDKESGALNPSEQFEIGQNLWRLFKDEEVFQRHRTTFEQVWWLAEEIDGVKKWLMDSTIVRRLDKAWRDEVQRAASPTRGFMRELVGMVVRGFLRERSWKVENASGWIDEFMSVDQKIQQPAEYPEADDASSSSSIVWDDMSAWCQVFLGLPDSELDSLWYERLAEASSLQGTDTDTVSLYQRAIAKENPSWLCHRGLGRMYFGNGRTADAIAEVELALKEVEQEGAAPKPEAKDIVELHLLLGQYNYEAGDAQSAAEHHELASNSEDTEQARQGQLGYLKARLSLLDAGGTRQLLKGVLADDGGEARMASILKMIAQDAEHRILVSKMFTVAKADPDLLKGIVRAMEVATETAGDDPYAEVEARGVLLYDRGVAAYRYKVSSDATEHVGAALRLWKESYELLANLYGRNASIARQDAITALAIYYFQSVVEAKNPAHIDALAQLAKDESRVNVSDLYGFLGALHACRGEKRKARAALSKHVGYALQILSDDIVENDVWGFIRIWKALVQYQDFTNAVFALSLIGQPDLLTEALLKLRGAIKKDPTIKQQYLDTVDKLATETIQVAKTEVPDAAQQVQRIEAAKAHIECLMAADGGKTKSKPDVGGDDSEVKESEEGSSDNGEAKESDEGNCNNGEAKESDEGCADDSEAKESEKKNRETAIHALHAHICALQQTHTPQIDASVWPFPWTCDGLTPDSKKCKNQTDFEHIFYHCVYCWNRDFCGDCLARLRNPDSGADITACSASHRWIQIPQQGGDMYVGLLAESARVPKEVRPVEGDDQILEIVYGDEGGNVVTVEAWKEALTREWGEEESEEGK